jgi:hypothetical protein
MKYKDIKDFNERCETHPDHQSGMISYSMIEQRLHEEIDELREYIEQRQFVGLTDEEIFVELERVDSHAKRLPAGLKIFAHYLEAKLKEKNT